MYYIAVSTVPYNAPLSSLSPTNFECLRWLPFRKLNLCDQLGFEPHTIFHLFAKAHWGSLPLTRLANGQVPWHSDDLVVRTDYGLFVDPLTGYQNRPNRQEFEESIDGQPARVVAFDQADGSRFTAAHFYDLGRLGAVPKKLTFVVISSGGRTADEALRITRSIRFRR